MYFDWHQPWLMRSNPMANQRPFVTCDKRPTGPPKEINKINFPALRYLAQVIPTRHSFKSATAILFHQRQSKDFKRS